MSIRFGVSPIAWINDDMPELGGDTPLERVLAEAREIGYTGIELGGKFPRDSQTLQALLARFELELVGGWYSANLLIRTAGEEIAALQAHLGLLKALGCRVFILAETSNAIHGDRARPLAATPRLDRTAWARFGAKLTEVADSVTAAGLRFAYHHHLGTVVESNDDIEWFLRSTGPSVGF
ncbi:MAG: TIM barrel protein, partial [Steroidobacteraceae bacterium]